MPYIDSAYSINNISGLNSAISSGASQATDTAAEKADFASMLSTAMLADATSSLMGSTMGTSSGILGGTTSDALLTSGLMGSSGLLGNTTGLTDMYSLMPMMLMGSGSSSMMTMMLLMLMSEDGSMTSALSSLFGSGADSSGSDGSCDICGTQGYTTLAASDGSGIPEQAWKPANPLLTSTTADRSAGLYRQIIDQFDVENNPRYAVNKEGRGDTYCNIFAWDVTRAMGAEVPHYTDRETGAIVPYGTEGAKAMNANSMNDWLNTYGAQYGWHEVTAEKAQYYANMGMPAVTTWKNTSGGHGHMQVVSPSQDGQYDETRGVAIAQAGQNLRNYCYITDLYGAGRMSQVQYFVHI